MTLQVAQYSILGLASLMVLGGVFAFIKAKSKISLIAAIVSSVLLDCCFAFSLSFPVVGIIAAFAVICCLDIMFVIRLVKTKSFMPSGMLLTLCIIEQAVLLFALPNVPSQ
jgi:uncharacterized membrane protein (UPF0136 family)